MLKHIFVFFSQKIGFDFSCKLHEISEPNEKNTVNLSFAEYDQRECVFGTYANSKHPDLTTKRHSLIRALPCKKVSYEDSRDQDQPVLLHSLIRAFTVCKQNHWILLTVWMERNAWMRLFCVCRMMWSHTFCACSKAPFRLMQPIGNLQYLVILQSKVSRPRWLSWMCRPTGDQEVAGSTPSEVGNILSWKLIRKYFLRSFSPFRWYKKGSCQFLAKECAQYWLTA